MPVTVLVLRPSPSPSRSSGSTRWWWTSPSRWCSLHACSASPPSSWHSRATVTTNRIRSLSVRRRRSSPHGLRVCWSWSTCVPCRTRWSTPAASVASRVASGLPRKPGAAGCSSSPGPAAPRCRRKPWRRPPTPAVATGPRSAPVPGPSGPTTRGTRSAGRRWWCRGPVRTRSPISRRPASRRSWSHRSARSTSRCPPPAHSKPMSWRSCGRPGPTPRTGRASSTGPRSSNPTGLVGRLRAPPDEQRRRSRRSRSAIPQGRTVRTSVVTLCSRPRLGHLERQLEAVGASIPTSGDAVERLVVWIGDDAPPTLDAELTVHLPPGSDGLRLAAGRNAGAALAIDRGADLIVFLDADCVPGPALLDRYREASDRHPGQCSAAR